MAVAEMQAFRIIGVRRKLDTQMALSKITACGKGQMPQLAVCGVFLILDNSEA